MAFLADYFNLIIYPLIALALLGLTLFLYFYPKSFSKYKIQHGTPKLSRIFKDALISMFTFYFFLPAGLFVAYCSFFNIGQIYHDVSSYGLPYFFFSILLLIFLQDTYYYWLHRLMHTPFLFRRIHITHHRSRNPTLVTYYAIHPIEAVCISLILPISIFLFPISDLALKCCVPLFTFHAIMSHSNYELMPRNCVTRWLCSSRVHNAHHQKLRVNYSFYFVIWDWLCGTLDEKNN